MKQQRTRKDCVVLCHLVMEMRLATYYYFDCFVVFGVFGNRFDLADKMKTATVKVIRDFVWIFIVELF